MTAETGHQTDGRPLTCHFFLMPRGAALQNSTISIASDSVRSPILGKLFGRFKLAKAPLSQMTVQLVSMIFAPLVFPA